MPSASIGFDVVDLSIDKAESFGGIAIGQPEMARLVDPAMFEDFGELHVCLARCRSKTHRRHACLQICHNKSRHAVVEIGAAAHNVDVGEFRPRLAGEMAHDAVAEFLGVLAAP